VSLYLHFIISRTCQRRTYHWGNRGDCLGRF